MGRVTSLGVEETSAADTDGARGCPRANALDRARIDEPFIILEVKMAAVCLLKASCVYDEDKRLQEAGGSRSWGGGMTAVSACDGFN
jgi:hypothetical protein